MNPIFLIFISSIIRYGQYPRIDCFKYSHEHEKYIYAGRELTADEFNVACARVFSPDFRGEGFTFCPLVLDEEVAAAAVEKREAREKAERKAIEDAADRANEAAKAEAEALDAENPTPEPEPEPEAQDVDVELSDSDADDPEPEAPQFTLKGKSIYLGEDRVAGLYGEEKQLRVFDEELRSQIEAFLAANPTPAE